MVGEKIDMVVTVASPEINGKNIGISLIPGEADEGINVVTADFGSSLGVFNKLWEYRVNQHAENKVVAGWAANTGDETIYISMHLTIIDLIGNITDVDSEENVLDAGKSTFPPLTIPETLLPSAGTYKIEVKLYGRRTTADTKTLLDTDIFYVHCYTEAIDIPAPALPDYEYRTAATFTDLETAAWAALPTSMVTNPDWWLQFRFNIANNGDEPVNIHIREAMDSTSKIAMTVTDPSAVASLLPVYMKQIEPGTSKQIETLGIQLSESGNWHFEGYVYAQRAYNRILDVNGDGITDVFDAIIIGRVIGGLYDTNSDGYMDESDIITNNLKIMPYWTHYAYALLDHLTMTAEPQIIAANAVGSIDATIVPEDAFVRQYNPLIIHAYGYYFYYDGTNSAFTTDETTALTNAVAGSKALRIEDGKLVTF